VRRWRCGGRPTRTTTPSPGTREEIGRFLHGLELLEPGVVPVDQWRPATPDAKPMEEFWLYAAVARKT